ncbi:unnamed protein product [Calicophoron daubneyi]|uniref:Uncharacterized protein n=1 Tax=Calicophoron daubneyi TaxID=300641 RepID=A0AAV2TUE2_CALDB
MLHPVLRFFWLPLILSSVAQKLGEKSDFTHCCALDENPCQTCRPLWVGEEEMKCDEEVDIPSIVGFAHHIALHSDINVPPPVYKIIGFIKFRDPPVSEPVYKVKIILVRMNVNVQSLSTVYNTLFAQDFLAGDSADVVYEAKLSDLVFDDPLQVPDTVNYFIYRQYDDPQKTEEYRATFNKDPNYYNAMPRLQEFIGEQFAEGGFRYKVRLPKHRRLPPLRRFNASKDNPVVRTYLALDEPSEKV